MPAVSGDFSVSNAVSGGAPCGGALAYTATCFVQIDFAPTAAGPRTGTLTLQAGSSTATAALTGYGDGQSWPVANTQRSGLQQCSRQLFHTADRHALEHRHHPRANRRGLFDDPQVPVRPASAPAVNTRHAQRRGHLLDCSYVHSGDGLGCERTLTIPVTNTAGGAPVLTNYTVPLTGAYTTEDEGLEIVADDAEYGPQATGSTGVTRQFTIDNLTAKPLTWRSRCRANLFSAARPARDLRPMQAATSRFVSAAG